MNSVLLSATSFSKVLLLAVCSFSFASCASVQASDDAAAASEWVDWGDNPFENPEFMEAFAAAGSPAEPHARMAADAGDYMVTGHMWMGPGQEPMPMTATSKITMVLNGRYMMEEFKMDFMGEPFEGLMLLGYDNIQQEYTSVWFDNMTTRPSVSTGQGKANGDMVLNGSVRDVITPDGRPYRIENYRHDDGSLEFKMFDTRPDGGEYMNMHTFYKRR